jgi:hypothetical protein
MSGKEMKMNDKLMKKLSQLAQPEVLIKLGIGLFLFALWTALYELGMRYNQGAGLSMIVATGMVVVLVAHGVMACQPSPQMRLAHGSAFALHMVIAIALSAFYVLSKAPELERQVVNLIGEFVTLGRTFYSALFGIAIAISLSTYIVSMASRSPVNGSQQAIASLATNIAIVLAIITSSIHLYQFGAEIAKLDLLSRLSATIMADISFIAIKSNIQHQIERRQKNNRYDYFDLIVWAVFGVVVSVYLILINSFVVRYTAGINDSGALLSLVVSLYGMSPTVLLAGLAALTVLTKVVDRETMPKSGARLDEQFATNGVANRQSVKM